MSAPLPVLRRHYKQRAAVTLHVACGCTDGGFIRVYDYARHFDTHALRGHGGPITALLFNTFALPVHGNTIPPHSLFGSGGVHAVAMKFAKNIIASLKKKSAS